MIKQPISGRGRSMLNMTSFIVPGEPVPKARPRVTRNGRTYTPKKTADYEKLVRASYEEQAGKYFGDGPLMCRISLYFPIPKSYGKRKTERIFDKKILYTKKPDIDNCVKAILDALNGIAYKDDSQVISIIASKDYVKGMESDGHVPCAVVKIFEVL